MRISPSISENWLPPHRKPFQRLLVAIDDSSQSDAAIEVAAQFAEQFGSDVVLINVFSDEYPSPDEPPMLPSEKQQERLKIGSHLLEAARRKMPSSSKVETVLSKGDVATQIVINAISSNADLIILGTHARGRVGQVIAGSVAREVTRRAPCPVMTVPLSSEKRVEYDETRARASVEALE